MRDRGEQGGPSAGSAGAILRLGSWLAVLLVVAAGLMVAALAVGVLPVPLSRLVTILLGTDDTVASAVVWQLRLPRFVLGLLAGAALASAGCLLQSALRNDLADPGLLGVSPGASLVVACVVVFNLPVAPGAVPFWALMGGLAAGLAVLLATRATRDPVQMILIGAALSSLFSALILFTVVLGSGLQVQIIYTYLVGSLAGRGWSDVARVAPWLGCGLLAAVVLVKPLGLLRLGDDVAEGLGLRVFRIRLLAMLVAVALTAPVVATCGPIGFVALVAPHLARAVLRTGAIGPVLSLAAALGAILLSAADILARWALRPSEVPVGLVATVIGAPVAVALLRRHVRLRTAGW